MLVERSWRDREIRTIVNDENIGIRKPGLWRRVNGSELRALTRMGINRAVNQHKMANIILKSSCRKVTIVQI